MTFPMLRRLCISCFVVICLVIHGSLSYGQVRSIGPYFGASGSLDIFNIFAGGNAGWGIEAGMNFRPFYAGIEYGGYSVLFAPAETYDPTPGSIPSPWPVPSANEQFWGVHAGYVFPHDSTMIYLGIVLLKSYQPWERWDSVSGWVTFTKSFLNIGPDLRVSGFDEGHIYLAFAYTIRRGLKAGLGYMF
ncbi:MAG TPA: hypothetical protein VFD13_05690 [Candidatus Kapabacteria bacterium]|nr:hypothetical protein [Candidatus Kapabacteria bacterium]